MTSEPGRWGDLQQRVISAAVMIAVGAVAIWLGGMWFLALVVLATGTMIWELSRLSLPGGQGVAVGLGFLAAITLLVTDFMAPAAGWGLLVLPPLGFVLTSRTDRPIAAGYALALMVAGHGLVHLRDQGGSAAILWVLSVVVITDVLGYFAGRILGGPKFWPQISPKKTWSGTVAGWIGAALVGGAFWLAGAGGVGLLVISPLIAFAGQLGDIAESALKRRAGVKDASGLIPGHGGVMDRFDALTGAMVAVMVLGLLVLLPVGG